MAHEALEQKSTGQTAVKETMNFNEGSLDILHIKSERIDPRTNPLIVIPGFTQGIEVMAGFGDALSQDGRREVYVFDQIDRNRKTLERPKPMTREGRQGLEQQVEAVLSFIEQHDLKDTPLDTVANSFAAPVLAKAAVYASNYGWACFKAEKGAHTFFIAPAGANTGEHILALGKRFGGWILKNASSGQVLDPNQEMMKAGVHNAMKDLPKTINEVRALAKVRIDFEELEQAGVKPFIFSYANDNLMPYGSWGANAEKNLSHLSGVASPIDNGGLGAKDYQDFKVKTGLSGKAAQEAWLHHYRSAEHNDMQFHPQRSAKAILQILDQE